MIEFSTFRDVISLWPSPGAMAAEVGAARAAGRKWAQRNNIPAEWWAPLLATSVAREAGLNAGMLAALAARAPATETDLVEGRI